MYGLAISQLADQLARDVELSVTPYGSFALVRGLHKLACSAELLLTTVRGSIAGMPDYGVDALNRLSSLTLSDTALLQRTMSELVAELTRQLDRLTRGLPDDARPSNLTLELVSLVGDELTVRLNLQSVAGSQAVYNLSLFRS